jgi:hypothetical protein
MNLVHALDEKKKETIKAFVDRRGGVLQLKILNPKFCK